MAGTAAPAPSAASGKPKWAALLKPGGPGTEDAPGQAAAAFPGLGKTQAGNILASLASQPISSSASPAPAAPRARHRAVIWWSCQYTSARCAPIAAAGPSSGANGSKRPATAAGGRRCRRHSGGQSRRRRSPGRQGNGPARLGQRRHLAIEAEGVLASPAAVPASLGVKALVRAGGSIVTRPRRRLSRPVPGDWTGKSRTKPPGSRARLVHFSTGQPRLVRFLFVFRAKVVTDAAARLPRPATAASKCPFPTAGALIANRPDAARPG